MKNKEYTMKLTAKAAFFDENSGSGRCRTKYGRLYQKLRTMPFNKALIVTLTKYASQSILKDGGLARYICGNLRYNRSHFKMRFRRISRTKNASKFIIIKLKEKRPK